MPHNAHTNFMTICTASELPVKHSHKCGCSNHDYRTHSDKVEIFVLAHIICSKLS